MSLMAYMPISLRRARSPFKSITCIPIAYICRYTTIQFDLDDYMSAKIHRVNRALNAAVPLRRPLDLHESMRYTLLAPGKRLCPILALASCELLAGDDSLAMTSACAAEMIVATSIILDDLPCMDDGDFRRGRPSNHRTFGEHVAVLAAGSLLSLSFQHVAERTVGVPVDRVLRILTELAKGCGSTGMAAGQIADIGSDGKAIGLEELKYIHEHKTAKLVEAAAVCGAIAGGGGDEEVDRLKKYARCVGLAHQVVDDIMDVTSSSEAIGKTAGKDAASDKATYPKLVGIERSREFARELAERAEEQLAVFDAGRAQPLCHLARFIANRMK